MTLYASKVKSIPELGASLLRCSEKEIVVMLALLSLGAAEGGGVTIAPIDLVKSIYGQSNRVIQPKEAVSAVGRLKDLGLLEVERREDGRATFVCPLILNLDVRKTNLSDRHTSSTSDVKVQIQKQTTDKSSKFSLPSRCNTTPGNIQSGSRAHASRARGLVLIVKSRFVVNRKRGLLGLKIKNTRNSKQGVIQPQRLQLRAGTRIAPCEFLPLRGVAEASAASERGVSSCSALISEQKRDDRNVDGLLLKTKKEKVKNKNKEEKEKENDRSSHEGAMQERLSSQSLAENKTNERTSATEKNDESSTQESRTQEEKNDESLAENKTNERTSERANCLNHNVNGADSRDKQQSVEQYDNKENLSPPELQKHIQQTQIEKQARSQIQSRYEEKQKTKSDNNPSSEALVSMVVEEEENEISREEVLEKMFYREQRAYAESCDDFFEPTYSKNCIDCRGRTMLETRVFDDLEAEHLHASKRAWPTIAAWNNKSLIAVSVLLPGQRLTIQQRSVVYRLQKAGIECRTYTKADGFTVLDVLYGKRQAATKHPVAKDYKKIAKLLVEHWAKKLGKSTKRLQVTEKRRDMVRDRLLENYSPRDLAMALSGVAYSEFHVKKGYTEFDRVVRSAEQVDKFFGIWSANAPLDEILRYMEITGTYVEARRDEIEQNERELAEYNRIQEKAETIRKEQERMAAIKQKEDEEEEAFIKQVEAEIAEEQKREKEGKEGE